MMKEVFTHRILEWRRIRFQAHQHGHKPDDLPNIDEMPQDQEIVLFQPELCYPNEKDGHFQDEELTLWDGEDWIEQVARENVIYKASKE